jgi:hypothetical protein
MDSSEITTISIDFTVDELWFLMSQFGPTYVTGIDNPYLGWLADEIQEATKGAVQSLVEKDIARVLTEDSIELDDAVVEMVRVCVHPLHTLLASIQPQIGEADGFQHYVHFAEPDWIVEHVEFEPGMHRLTAIRDQQALVELLQDDLRLDSAAASAPPAFKLRQETLHAAARLYIEGKAPEGLSLLEESGLEAAVCQRLGAVLAAPVANASYVVMKNRNNSDRNFTCGFGYLEGEAELWLMRPFKQGDEAWVEFTPGSAELVRAKFLEILPGC